MPKPRKTARKWGVWNSIRRYAAGAGYFSPEDLPWLSRSQARSNCRGLMLRGDLRLIESGLSGNPGRKLLNRRAPPIYAAPKP
jgi:hypothetical protein